MTTRTQYLLLLIPVVLLSACMMGPKMEKMELEPAESWMNNETQLVDSMSNPKWWLLFEDDNLDSLIYLALNQNKNVRIAMSRVEQARATAGYNRADRFPSVGVQGEISRGNFPLYQFGEQGNLIGAASLAWELDFWGKYRSLTLAAQKDFLSSEYALRSAQMSLISEVAQLYFELLDYQYRLDIAQRTLIARDSSVAIVGSKFEYGVIPEIDLNQAQIQRAIAAAAVPVYRREIAKTKNTLNVLLGRNPGEIDTEKSLLEQPFDLDIPIGLPSSLLQRRPDILAAEAAAKAQNDRISAAIAMRFPSISLTGILGAASNDLSNIASGGVVWSAGAGLVGPVFQFGKNKRRVEIERAKTDQAVLQYEQTVLVAFQEVENALIGISTYKEELIARQDNVTAANSARFLSQERYNRGVTSYLEVLETQRAAFDAELAYSQTRRALLNTYIQLYKALGGGWLNEEESNNTP